MKNEEVLSAEEFLKDLQYEYEETQEYKMYFAIDIPNMMSNFAKLHVNAALKAASENAITRKSNCHCGFGYPKIDRDSILKSYPLDKIK